MLALLAATVGLAVAAAPASASFNASISGKVTSNGTAGLFNVAVTVYDANNNQVGSTFTDANGDYTDNIFVFMPSPTTVTVFFGGVAGSNNYASQWYNGQPTSQTATPVTVTSGQAVAGINATLVHPGVITG